MGGDPLLTAQLVRKIATIPIEPQCGRAVSGRPHRNNGRLLVVEATMAQCWYPELLEEGVL